jgi:hypothetical protein
LSQINTICKKAWIVFLFSNLSIYAQFNYSFLKYLSAENLPREHKTYILSTATKLPADSVSYFTSKYYLQYFNDSLLLDNYLKSKPIFVQDTDACNLASIAFLNHPKKDIWFTSYTALHGKAIIANTVYSLYLASQNPMHTDSAMIPEKLQPDFMNYKKYYIKKPWVAAALSTAVPGLGELYAGKKKSFINTLILNIMYGAQAYEATYKLGIKKPFSIFSIGFFGVFYFANIYGSYYDVKQGKKEKRKQLLIDATNYYNINCTSKLYP